MREPRASDTPTHPGDRPRDAAGKRGTRLLAAAVAMAMFLWLTTAVTGAARGPGLFLALSYLLLVFLLLAARDVERDAAVRPSLFSAFAEGALWHGLCGAFLIFLGPLVYLAFIIAGGSGSMAYRWLGAPR
ncbi:MAG: hypothetical protein CMN73_12065 [Sphingomonas sp.]|nr:hypothetical protein [Sphingomonas sp.]